MSDLTGMSFEEAMKKLEAVVRDLESGNVELEKSIALYEEGARLKAHCEKLLKEAEARLTEAVLKKYPALTMGEIQTLVVQDKWLADITAAIGAEVEARTESLTARVRVLTERYGQTLPQIMQDLAELEARVAGHLAAMGVAG